MILWHERENEKEGRRKLAYQFNSYHLQYLNVMFYHDE